jgi:hypothetical protein
MSNSLVGTYGANTAITPMLDELASRGIVLDQCFLDSRDSRQMLLSLWSGQHFLQRHASAIAPEELDNLWRKVSAAGHDSFLITDCPHAADLAERLGCTSVQLIEHDVDRLEPAQESLECHLADLIMAAGAMLENPEVGVSAAANSTVGEPAVRLCWIHSRGFKQVWDAPLKLRHRFVEADDPDPPTGVAPPCFAIQEQTDPDLVVGWAQVAAAQASVVDQSIALLHELTGQAKLECSWCIIGLDGYPLGEHGYVGYGNESMHSEQMQVAAIFRPATNPPIGWRVSQLCQLPDLAACIGELCGVELASSWSRNQLGQPLDCSTAQWPAALQTIGVCEQQQRWIRTAAWSLSYSIDGKEQLYVKPDDRWEVSEVSCRCREVVEELKILAEKFFEAASQGQRDSLPPVVDALSNLLR